MITIDDTVDWGGQYFSTPKKNLGNKLFMYIGARLISDLLDINLIVPEKAIIRRESNFDNQWIDQYFPFKSILNRKEIKEPIIDLNNGTFQHYSINDIVENYKNHGFLYKSDFANYNYIKSHKNLVKEIYKSLIQPQREDNSLIILLRNSNTGTDFEIKNDSYYINIIENENFDKLYVSLDHINKHQGLLEKLSKYKPIILDGSILDIFSQITSFKKIIASQGTFSFWACFLSNAEKIYYPITNYGPNKINRDVHFNILIDDEDRYQNIEVYEEAYST
jgi:hypothetical protein